MDGKLDVICVVLILLCMLTYAIYAYPTVERLLG